MDKNQIFDIIFEHHRNVTSFRLVNFANIQLPLRRPQNRRHVRPTQTEKSMKLKLVMAAAAIACLGMSAAIAANEPQVVRQEMMKKVGNGVETIEYIMLSPFKSTGLVLLERNNHERIARQQGSSGRLEL